MRGRYSLCPSSRSVLTEMPLCMLAKSGEFCGYCYDGRKGRCYHKGHLGYRKPRETDDTMAKRPIKREAPPPSGPPRPTAQSYSEFESKWPILYSYLFDCQYEDGSARVPASLSFFVDKGILKVSLNDKDLRRVAFVAVSGPLEAFDKLEAALDLDSLDWRVSRDR